MGCSAGKQLSTSPDVSASSQINNTVPPPIHKENGWTNPDHRLVDVEKLNNSCSPNGGNKSKKESVSSASSTKEPDTPQQPLKPSSLPAKPKPAQLPAKPAREKENGGPTKKCLPSKTRNSDETQVKAIPLGQLKVQLTQSQTDFFTLLDEKIAAGADYVSGGES